MSAEYIIQNENTVSYYTTEEHDNKSQSFIETPNYKYIVRIDNYIKFDQKNICSLIIKNRNSDIEFINDYYSTYSLFTKETQLIDIVNFINGLLQN